MGRMITKMMRVMMMMMITTMMMTMMMRTTMMMIMMMMMTLAHNHDHCYRGMLSECPNTAPAPTHTPF